MKNSINYRIGKLNNQYNLIVVEYENKFPIGYLLFDEILCSANLDILKYKLKLMKKATKYPVIDLHNFPNTI